MADPQRHSEDHPRRSRPIQPDRPGRGVGTERDAPDDRDTSNRTVRRQHEQSDSALDNTREGYD